MLNIFAQLDKLQAHYNALPQPMRQSILPWVITSIPVIISSLFSAYQAMPVIIAITVYLLYLVTNHTDTFIFNLTAKEARARITMPLVTLIPAWGVLAAFLSRKEMVLGIIGPFAGVLLLCAAPAYRLKMTRMKRYVPLELSFGLVGIFLVIASLNYINF